MSQTFLVGNENFSPLIEEIALKFNMSLRGKCFMFIFKEQFLNQIFKDIINDSKLVNPAYVFINKLNTMKLQCSTKALERYDNLLYRFGLPLDRDLQDSTKSTNLLPFYFNKPGYDITKQKAETTRKAKLWDEIINNWQKNGLTTKKNI